jgi:hypothetical protein
MILYQLRGYSSEAGSQGYGTKFKYGLPLIEVVDPRTETTAWR